MDVLSIVLVVLGIIIALVFNFSNGRNNASNAVATVVATHALSPVKAIVIASICCLAGPFVFSPAVAKTIGGGIVDPELFTPVLMFIGLCGSVLWVNICSRAGIPVSSTHALVGGLIGAGVAAAGWSAVFWPTAEMLLGTLFFVLAGAFAGAFIALILALIFKERIGYFLLSGAAVGGILAIPLALVLGVFPGSNILSILLFICVAPMLGIVAAYTFTAILTRIIAKCSKAPMRLNKWFQRLQVVGSAFQALTIGGNDAQNAMGIIFAILVSAGLVSAGAELPLWVIITSAIAITLGMLLGGWKIIKNVGSGITRIMPYQGFSATTTGGLVLTLMTACGIPVSTTHVAGGAIIGTGMTRGAGGINWKTVLRMLSAWVITIPCAAVVSWVIYFASSHIFGF
ncbi:MAG TPA: inorganic phosphate transporter [Methanocorpusculum sp.]|nr:inorganic phosphate transporter [Methanocorpusculum sp.]